MSSFFSFGSVTGASQEIAGFYNDGKAGRINFLVTHISGSAVSIAARESKLDGSSSAVIASPQTLNVGGQITVSVNSVKEVLSLISGSGNTGEAYVRIDAIYLGTYGRGTLGLKERNPKTGFSGADIPR